MNLGQRMKGILLAMSGDLASSVADNTAADENFRLATEETLAILGTKTTELNDAVTAINEKIASGQTITAEEFAVVRDAVASLNEAFPDETVAPPADDEPEAAIEVPASE